MKIIKYNSKLLIVLNIVFFGALVSCEDDDRYDDIDRDFISSLTVPEAGFDYVIQDRLVTFTNNSVGATEYSWNFDDDQAIESEEENPVFEFDEDVETTPITLSARNSESNVTNQFSTEIMFVKADFIIAELNEGVVSFESTSLAAVSYLWDFGDGLGTSTEENPTYEYTTFGTFTVTLTVTDSFGNTDEIVNTDIVIPQPGAGTFEAEIIAGDFVSAIWDNIQNPWAVNPDNSSDYDFWDNIALESVVQALDGGSDKGSSSSTSNFTDDSLKLDRDSKRAYQPINIESDVDYTITAYVKNKSASAGDLVGTFYVLPYEPEDESIILTDNLIAHEVFASDTGSWDEATFEFTTTSVFSFDQDSVDNQDDDILTSVNQEWVVLYFVPTLTTADEVNLDDVSIITKGF